MTLVYFLGGAGKEGEVCQVFNHGKVPFVTEFTSDLPLGTSVKPKGFVDVKHLVRVTPVHAYAYPGVDPSGRHTGECSLQYLPKDVVGKGGFIMGWLGGYMPDRITVRVDADGIAEMRAY